MQRPPLFTNIVTALAGEDPNTAIQAARCIGPPIGCGKKIEGFHDPLSRREYSITGLCQNCQDALEAAMDEEEG